MAIWFTVQLADRPGSLARLASALAGADVNITGVVGVAEDTQGALMLTTSNAVATRRVLGELAVVFEEHDSDASALPPGGLAGIRRGLAERGMDVDAGR